MTVRSTLTWKLVLGFLFAVVLQVCQMLIGSHFTGRMQAASEQVSAAMKASLAVQAGIDAARELRDRIDADRDGPSATPDPVVYQVYLDAVDEQFVVLQGTLAPVAAGKFAAIATSLAAARAELLSVHAAMRARSPTEPLPDALDFFDDAVGELAQALSRSAIEVRAIAAQGVESERAVHDLPVRASLGITLSGVALMAVFVAWFSRQLVVPIQRAWDELESRVAERTGALAHAVEELESEIVERQRAERQKEDLHRQLVESSRRAGMAELANGVLHNVGNVLNSVNVCTNVLVDRLRKSRVPGLRRAAGLLREHERDLADFLTTSPQGSKLPEYLERLGEHLTTENEALLAETEDLSRRVDMMKEIVSRQQSYARVSGTTQCSRLSEVVEDVLRMHATAFADLDIRVATDFAWDDVCEFDRSRVMQILMNLVTNAKHALRDREAGGAVLQIETALVDGDRIRIRVRDNGVGIAEENLARIFGHGFTTKRDGHGFGLHHSANAAAEMGGRLGVESDGIGKGATFTLELPLQRVGPTGAPAAAMQPAGARP